LIWFTSDLHINHENIIKYCNRPFESIDRMNSELVERWNSKISIDDTVYVVGDVFLGSPELASPIIRKLNGKKILVLGNHDRSPKTMIECGFEEVHKKLEIKLQDGRHALLSHKPLPALLLSEYDMQIHGHRHSGPAVAGKRINVCVDLWGYEPVPENEICDIVLESDNFSSSCHISIFHDKETVTINAKIQREDLEGLIEHLTEYKNILWK